MIFIKFCGFIVHSNPNNMTHRLFPEISLKLEKYILIFLPSRNVAPKPTDQSCSNSIFSLLLQLPPARPFHFWPTLNIKDTLMLRVVHIRNKKWSNKHGIFKHDQLFLLLLLNQQERSPRKYCYQSYEIYCLWK